MHHGHAAANRRHRDPERQTVHRNNRGGRRLEPDGTAILNRDGEFAPLLAERARAHGAKVVFFGEHPEAQARLLKCSLHEDCTTITADILGESITYKLGAPEIREHTSWWWQYVFVSVIAYSELKNIIVRVAQIRHILRQDEWVVTPRGHVDRTSTRT